MGKRKLSFVLEILVTFISLILVASSEPVQTHFRGGKCRTFDNFTPNTTYHSNLLSLLSILNAESAHSKYFDFSYGVGRNRINGLYHCRPDTSFETCHACINAATQVLFEKCATKKEAILWYEECTLRYTNRSIVFEEVVEPNTWAFSTLNVSQPEMFLGLINKTVEGLIARTVLPSNTLRLATSKDNFTYFEGLFGLALCTPDITNLECEVCLRLAWSIFPTCCGNLAQYAMVFLPNCHLRYDTAPFIFDSSAPPPVLAPAPAPAPQRLRSSRVPLPGR